MSSDQRYTNVLKIIEMGYSQKDKKKIQSIFPMSWFYPDWDQILILITIVYNQALISFVITLISLSKLIGKNTVYLFGNEGMMSLSFEGVVGASTKQ